MLQLVIALRQIEVHEFATDSCSFSTIQWFRFGMVTCWTVIFNICHELNVMHQLLCYEHHKTICIQ
ncbi:hypothetical protein DAI22_02g298432 [Oryza sativa Japonica Group]|jgi:hypothetical protein|nr:hypothetical protein DAI22_02g298432 [Oryza sativa Japonica Group]